METGKVKFFDTRPDKRYGFILVDGGTEQLFFHYNDGQFLIAGKTQPKFSDKATVVSQGKTYRMGDPKQDDLVVFERADGLEGRQSLSLGLQVPLRQVRRNHRQPPRTRHIPSSCNNEQRRRTGK